MSEVRKYRKFRQREPLRVPSIWKSEDRAFAIQLNGQLDTIFADMGRIQQSAETIPTADQIQRTAENTQTVEQALASLNDSLSVVNGKVCITYST